MSDVHTAAPANAVTVAQQQPVTTKPDPRKRIRGRLKAALDMMVWEGVPWNEAAPKANFGVPAMRKALERAHVLAYLREQKQVFRTSASSQNISALVKLRDTAGNAMAQLGAIKVLEHIDESETPRGIGASPGVTIVIAAPLTGRDREIDAKPLISLTRGSDIL